MKRFTHRIIRCGWLLAFLALSSCERPEAEVNITLQPDYSAIIAAIDNVNTTLSEKLATIEKAVSDGLADNQAALTLIRQAVASLEGTIAEKLAAVEAAVKAQTTSLETKLALIEAAVSSGFADSKAQQSLLKQAIESLGGTLAEKLSAVETAVKAQTTGLETKLGLIEAAVTTGLADAKTQQGLIKEAIETLGGTMEEKLAAIDTVLGSQTADLSAKLGLIETAVKEGFAGNKTQQELLRQAIEALAGTTEEKLAAIETAVKGQTTSLETKLGLIEAAVKAGFADGKAQQELIQAAIESLGGTVEEKLSAIESAVSGETADLAAKLAAIETALTTGLTGVNGTLALIKTAVESVKGSVTTLDSQLSGKIDEVVSALDGIAASLSDETAPDDIAAKLKAILGVLTDRTDYTEILETISTALRNVLQYIHFPTYINGHEYIDMGEATFGEGDEVMTMHLKWATCNVGARHPWEFGDYFAWAETAPKEAYSWETYKYSTSDEKHITKYTFDDGEYPCIWYNESKEFIGDGLRELQAEDDAASKNWGGSWRTPSFMEWLVFRASTSFEWVWTNDYKGDGSGIAGMTVTRKDGPCAGNSIFLPAAGAWSEEGYLPAASGIYWCNDNHSDASWYAMMVVFGEKSFFPFYLQRYYGMSVRPVSE